MEEAGSPGRRRMQLSNTGTSPVIEDLDGWTLHRLRHRALTHDAEDGTSTPMLLARLPPRPSAPWSDTHGPVSTRSPDTSPKATPRPADGCKTLCGW